MNRRCQLLERVSSTERLHYVLENRYAIVFDAIFQGWQGCRFNDCSHWVRGSIVVYPIFEINGRMYVGVPRGYWISDA